MNSALIETAYDTLKGVREYKTQFGNLEAIKIHSSSASIRSILQGKLMSTILEKLRKTQQVVDRESAVVTKLEDTLSLSRERMRTLNLKNAGLQELVEE
jgi:hypothetical protein